MVPVVAAPMFLASGPDLVVECCKAGIIGTFPSLNQRSTDGYRQWLVDIKRRLKAAEAEHPGTVAGFGVNHIVHSSNPRLQEDLAVTVEHEVPLVITSLGAVKDVVDAVHSYGGVVFHDVINMRHARSAARAGVDGLILVTAGAGGHAGSTNPFALVKEVRSFFDGTILLAGCISTGSDVVAARAMGADLAYLGTRFIATNEAIVQDGYKDMIKDSTSKDIVYTKEISGVNANFLTKSIQNAGMDPFNLKPKTEIDFGKELDASKAWKDIWSAGQGVGAINDVLPTKALIHRMRDEYAEAMNNLNRDTLQPKL